MSIQSEIERINGNVQSTLSTIAETGVEVGTNSDALPAAAAALANEKAPVNHTHDPIGAFPNGTWWAKSNISSAITSVYYDDGLFVAGGESGIYYSADGSIWTPSNITDETIAVYKHRSTWLANVNNTIYYSVDGKTWTSTGVSGASLENFYSANGQVLIGSTAARYTSTDGIAWTTTSQSNGLVKTWKYANNLYVGAGGKGLRYSTNGTSWTASNVSSGTFYTIEYFKGVWVAGGNMGMFYSDDGKTWTKITTVGTMTTPRCVADNLMLASASNSDNGIYYSTDGKVWTQSNLTNTRAVNIVHGNGRFAAYNGLGGGLYYSEDGITWFATNNVEACNTAYHARILCHGNGVWAAASNSGLYYSVCFAPSSPELDERISQLSAEIENLSGESVTVPDYWQSHIDSKIAAIKALQDEGGKDAFSFIVIADPHYPQNLGKNSGKLARKIMDECDIRYALVLGDMQNRGSNSTKEAALADFDGIRTMFNPIAANVLYQRGNHDGSWGSTLNGVTYPYNFTPEELYNRVYAPTYKYHNVVTDESGSGYYLDDTARKVRYILLNTHCNPYEENADGSAKYNNMKHARFTQSQYDMVIDALNTVPGDSWAVIVAAHVPVNNAYGDPFGDESNVLGDHIVMRKLLTAYKNKAAYTQAWAGTAGGSGGGGYANLFDTNGTGYEAWNGSKMYTNWIPYGEYVEATGDAAIYHFKGWSSDNSPYKYHLAVDANGTNASALAYTNSTNIYIQQPLATSDYDSSVRTMKPQNNPDYTHIRFEFREDVASNLIITANEDIIEATGGDGGYDAVSIDVDFSAAKGQFVSYFSGHMHADYIYSATSGWGIDIITVRCDGANENNSTLLAERVAGTITEQSFDVFTVDRKTGMIYATKIGAGADRSVSYSGTAVVRYSVTNTLTNCTNSNGASSVQSGAAYRGTITANSGYELSSVTVKMGGTDITSTAVSGGTISIAAVTGDVVITAVATAKEAETYNVTNTLTNCSSSNSAATATAGTAYSATITAADGYTLEGASVSVKMGGADITSSAYSNGKITIASVTGNIVISVSAVASGPAYTNLFDINGDGFTVETEGSKYLTNWIPYDHADNDNTGTIYHFKGFANNAGYTNPYKMQFRGRNGEIAATRPYCTNANQQGNVVADYDSSVRLVQHHVDADTYGYIRFEFREAIPENLIITANEQIV